MTIWTDIIKKMTSWFDTTDETTTWTDQTEQTTDWGGATSPTTPATPLAFPTALGYGKDSVGGRGGQIYYVTTTADTWDPGSLRYGLYSLSGPRIILFKVSGYIDLSLPTSASSKDIAIVNPYVTIAGHTAPGEGVCIRNGGIAIQTHDVIIRNLRIRPGDGAGSAPVDRDCIKLQGASNVVIDHCSLTWSIDENISTWVHNGVYPKNITIQNCIIAEGLYNSTHPEGNHSRGLLVGDGSSRITIVHNMFMSNNRRNPMIKGACTDIEVVNNIIYNWGSDTNTPGGVATNFSDSDTGGANPIRAAIVNNYYAQGPNLGTVPLSFDQVNPGSLIYLSGNQLYMDDAAYIAAYPFLYSAGPFMDAVLNWSIVDILGKVGATVPALDDVDTRLLNEASAGQGALIDSPTDVGGYPALASGTPYVDTDSDGMYDVWETANGLVIGVDDSSGDANGDGYTNIENFLNELAGDYS